MPTLLDKIDAASAAIAALVAHATATDTKNADLTAELSVANTKIDELIALLPAGVAPPTAAAPLVISGQPAVQNVAVGDTVSFTPTVTGGVAPYRFSFANPSPLFSHDETTGAVLGSNLPAGTYGFVITVEDSSVPQPETATLSPFSITVG